MEEFSAIAAREKVQLNMVSIEPITATTVITQTQSSNAGSKRFNNRQKKHCNQCNKDVNENNAHCNTCQKCRPGTICWECEPEKAPDSWHGKEKALQKRNQYSMTASHQNRNSSIRPTNQGNFLFGSNFMMIDQIEDCPKPTDHLNSNRNTVKSSDYFDRSSIIARAAVRSDSPYEHTYTDES
jgi:hypothetical protein